MRYCPKFLNTQFGTERRHTTRSRPYVKDWAVRAARSCCLAAVKCLRCWTCSTPGKTYLITWNPFLLYMSHSYRSCCINLVTYHYIADSFHEYLERKWHWIVVFSRVSGNHHSLLLSQPFCFQPIFLLSSIILSVVPCFKCPYSVNGHSKQLCSMWRANGHRWSRSVNKPAEVNEGEISRAAQFLIIEQNKWW